MSLGLANRIERTTLLNGLFAGILLGLVVARTNWAAQLLWAVVLAFTAITVVGRRRKLTIFAVCFWIGCVAGSSRGSNFAELLNSYQQLSKQKVTMQVMADSSAVYVDNSQLEFDATRVVVLSPTNKKLPGKIVVSGYGVNSILRGDTVLVEGTLHSRRGSKVAGISYAKLQVQKRSASMLERLRRNFLTGLANALPEPHDQFAAGLLIGQRSELPDNVSLTLRAVGLSHIIAVSGYNLTIMSDVARRRFGKKSKFRSSLFSIILVMVFVAIAGSSASIARAAFVSIFTILAAHYGRSVKPLTLLLSAAAYTALSNPINIWSDVGWYLSFLAFFGVLILAPSILNRLTINNKPQHAIKMLLIETASAQFMTVPITMYLFGQVSLIALLANIIVVPLVPLAMLLSLLSGIAGMLAPSVSAIIAWPAKMLLDSMLGVSEILSRVPHAFTGVSLNAWQMTAAYVLVVVVIIALRHKAASSSIISE